MKLSLEEFCFAIPKVELHAHLNGSLSFKTIQKLIQIHNKKWPLENIPSETEILSLAKKDLDIEEVFKLFPLIQKLTDHPEAIKFATESVIKDFADENVRYLELRSTPVNVNGKMTKHEYVQAIIDGIMCCEMSSPLIKVKLLLSVNRSQSLVSAKETVLICQDFHKKYPNIVVGIDLSGDPKKGDVIPLLKVFNSLRKESSLKFSFHIAEIHGMHNETEVLLSFFPDRVGHGTFIHPDSGGSQHLYDILAKQNIPVEVCLTSNCLTKTVTNYQDSHLVPLYKSAHPIVICTDDKGVFNCNLTNEYVIVAKCLGLSKEDIYKLSLKSIDYIFSASNVKEYLKAQWKDWLDEHNYLF
ncbi:adenosine deaminase-like protein [Hydra vulgaris]|nr:adenosine deaminase-like protein [Hydra vulgaris]